MRQFARVTAPLLAAFALIVLGTSKVSIAGVPPAMCVALPPSGVPEIDAASGVAALALIAGAVLIIRGRRSKAGL
jgi:hypothetical protein